MLNDYNMPVGSAVHMRRERRVSFFLIILCKCDCKLSVPNENGRPVGSVVHVYGSEKFPCNSRARI